MEVRWDNHWLRTALWGELFTTYEKFSLYLNVEPHVYQTCFCVFKFLHVRLEAQCQCMRRDISIPRWDQWVRRRSSDYLKEYFRLAGLLDNCRIMENVDLLMSALCQYFDWYAEKHNQKRSEFLGYSGKMDHSQTWSTSHDEYIYIYIHNIIPSTPETMV